MLKSKNVNNDVSKDSPIRHKEGGVGKIRVCAGVNITDSSPTASVCEVNSFFLHSAHVFLLLLLYSSLVKKQPRFYFT